MSAALAEGCPALVLNADFRPLNYFPLSLWSWQDAVKAVFLSRVTVVSEYDNIIRSPTREMRLPSVIALKEYVHMSRKPAFTRFNVFLRDGFSDISSQQNSTFNWCTWHEVNTHDSSFRSDQFNGDLGPPTGVTANIKHKIALPNKLEPFLNLFEFEG